MRRNFLKYVACVGLASVFLTVGVAIARDNDDRKDRSNKGGNSSSNNNGGGGGGGSSSRNIAPSGSSGQSRSSSGGDSARSSSGRSAQTIQIPNSGGSTRSFGSGSDKSTFGGKSFNGSGNRGSDSGSKATRSTVARPVDGVIQNGGGNGSGGNGGPSVQGFPRGNQSGGNSDGPSVRNFSNGPGNSTQPNRLSDASQQPNGPPDNNNRGNGKVRGQNKDGDVSNNNQNAVKRNIGGPNNPNNPNNPNVSGPNSQPGNTISTGNTFGNNKGDNRSARPQQGQQGQQSNQTTGPGNDSKVSKDKVESFLQMRRDNGGGSTVGSGNNPVGGKFNRDGNNGGDGRNAFKIGQPGSDKNFGDGKKVADQSWEKRFGTGGDIGRRNKDGKPPGGKDDIRTGIGNQKGNVPGGDRSFDNRKFDKNFVDRNYQDWRKGGNDGKRDGGKDNRDWSGQWKNGDRFVAADQIRNHWKNNGNGKNMPFSKDWWDGHDHHGQHDHHDGHWNHWDHFGDHHYHPYHWWSSCSAPRLTTWVSFGWNTPYYWDYGPGEYIYTNNGIVYVNGTWFEPAPVFYRRTLLLAQQAPVWTPAQAAQVNWLPLGVFVVARDGVADNNVLVQLAVTQEGVIGGTIFNQLTGAEFPIQGMVDKQTQRAAWTYTDDTGAQIAMESSIFNLTQPAATGLIHYSPDDIQVMELVRLENPNAGQ